MNQLEWEKKHYRRVAGYSKQIDAIFSEATREAAAIGSLFDANDLFSKPFSFKDYPATTARVNKMMERVHQGITTVVVNGATAEWDNSNLKNDEIAMRVLGIKEKGDIPGKFKKYFNNNGPALKAFLERKEKGLKLSDRVWKYTNGFKQEIELGLDTGIRAGKPASEMARDLKQYLKEPNKLFRRVRDQHGNLQLSKAAKAYNPGRGVYRSSYKNAMRLTRTETNMAYRAADHTRMQQLDFVVGIEVRLTNNPAHVYDICDELKGRYPKDFKFVGWHPHCMCHAITILKTPDELNQDIDRIQEGKPTTSDSQNKVEGLPQNFKEWAERNKDRIATAKSQPYFIRDNFTGAKIEEWFKKQKVVPAAAIPAPVEVPKVTSKLTPENSNRYDIDEQWERIQDINFDSILPDQSGRYAQGKMTQKIEIESPTTPNARLNISVDVPIKVRLNDGTMMEVSAKTANVTGVFDSSAKTFTFTKIYLDEPLRGKGIAEYILQKAKQQIPAGYTLRTTEVFSPEGKALFERMTKKGFFKKPTAKEVSAARHAARTPEQRAAIQKAWDERKKTTSTIQIQIKTAEDARIEISRIGGSDWFTSGFNKFKITSDKGVNGSTSRAEGIISLSKERMNAAKSGLEKIRIGAELTKKEADALATFWHEITHNRNAFPRTYSEKGAGTKYMELANEFISRKTLPEFYQKLGVKDMPFKEFMTTRASTGYNDMVRNFQTLINEMKLSDEKVTESVKRKLFRTGYDRQKEGLIASIIDNLSTAGINTKNITFYEIEEMMEQCLALTPIKYRTWIQRYLKKVIP